jgi:hypothetical protein
MASRRLPQNTNSAPLRTSQPIFSTRCSAPSRRSRNNSALRMSITQSVECCHQSNNHAADAADATLCDFASRPELDVFLRSYATDCPRRFPFSRRRSSGIDDIHFCGWAVARLAMALRRVSGLKHGSVADARSEKGHGLFGRFAQAWARHTDRFAASPALGTEPRETIRPLPVHKPAILRSRAVP